MHAHAVELAIGQYTIPLDLYIVEDVQEGQVTEQHLLQLLQSACT